jgi:hypothetical protein
MTKIKITESQYNKILLNRQTEALSNQPIINEGWGDIVLGVALLLGVKLSGQNEIIGQNAISDDNIMGQIKQTLEDDTKIKELVKSFTDKGMNNPDTRFAKNAKNIVTKFNDIAKTNGKDYRISTKVINNLEALDKNLNLEVETKTETIPKPSIEDIDLFIKDNMVINLFNDKVFDDANSKLNNTGSEIITNLINIINDTNIKVLSISIESSTDAQPAPIYKTEYDSSGNIELTTLRTKSIALLLSKIKHNPNIRHREIPNNANDIVNTKQFLTAKNDPNELDSLKDKTSEYRYTKLTIELLYTDKISNDVKPEELSNEYRGKFKDLIPTEDNGKYSFNNKKIKCNKTKETISCSTY